MKICLLTLAHHFPQLNNIQNTLLENLEAAALCATIWCLPALMRDPCKNQWSMFTTSQPTPGKSRTTFTTQAPHGLLLHIYTKYKWPLPGCHSRRRRKFPTAPVDDNIWLENPVPDRHSYICKQLQPLYQCSFPCPYPLDLPQSAPVDAPAPYYEVMDLSDISDFQDVMTTTSDGDIPDLEDILWIWTMAWINNFAPWAL